MDEKTRELVERLSALDHSFVPYPRSGGSPQTVGSETWKLICTGEQRGALSDAIDAIRARGEKP